MSKPIIIECNEDLPCENWEHKMISECPMRKKWYEGEVKMCGDCGWQIEYKSN